MHTENQGMTELPLSERAAPVNDSRHVSQSSSANMPSVNGPWIAGRIETLLSHYFQPDNPVEVFEGALDDWIATLEKFPQEAIEHACGVWVRNYQSKRPTPASIANLAQHWRKVERERAKASTSDGPSRGDRSELSFDEMEVLERILDRSRSWMDLRQNSFGETVFARPTLARHGAETLTYWGEDLPSNIPQHLLEGL